MIWYTCLKDQLETLWSEGHTIKVISERMGVSESQIDGQAKRQGLPKRTTEHLRRKLFVPAEAPKDPIADALACHEAETTGLMAPERPEVVAEADETDGGDIATSQQSPTRRLPPSMWPKPKNPHHCLFPLWDSKSKQSGDPNRDFCADSKEENSSYCKHHHSIVHPPAKLDGHP